MSIDEYIDDNKSCFECRYFAMTEAERTEHVEKGPCPAESPLANIFPEYYVCRASDENRNVYLRIDGESGPFYTAYEGADTVDEAPPYTLMRHDWELVERGATPFEGLEE